MGNILKSIHTQWMRNTTKFPLDLYLSYLTFWAPLPVRGTHIAYSLCDGNKFSIEYPSLNQLPYVWNEFYFKFFNEKYLSISNLLDTLYWMLTQIGSVFIVSTSPLNIVTATEVLRTIIFPFEHKDTYIISLPEELYTYWASPFPLFLGIPLKSNFNIETIIK